MQSFKINMFQCIICVDSTLSMKEMDKMLQIPHKCYAPGSLGKEVIDKSIYQIGSISFKQKINEKNTSILAFSTHKIKISGGLNIQKDITNEEFEIFLREQIIQPVVDMLYPENTSYTIDKKMINATMYRKRKIGKANFMEFIEQLKIVFEDQYVILPDIMIKNGKRRGRICAVKVKQPDGTGQFAVDHGGNVQFFSYACLYSLQKHKSALMKVWL